MKARLNHHAEKWLLGLLALALGGVLGFLATKAQTNQHTDYSSSSISGIHE